MQWPQVFLHLAMPSSPLQKVVDAVFASHQDEPKPAMSLSSHAGGGGHWVAAVHAFLHVLRVLLHFFLQAFFVLPSTMHSLLHGVKASSHLSLQISNSAGLWHGDGGGGGDLTVIGDGGGDGGSGQVHRWSSAARGRETVGFYDDAKHLGARFE